MPNNKSNLYFCGDDKIQRGIYAQNLVRIIKRNNEEDRLYRRSNDNDSFVVGIDAPWGTGKTQFVKMLKSCLSGNWRDPDNMTSDMTEEEKKTGAAAPADTDMIRTIYYDAWSNDFWNNAFEPFFDCIINSEAMAPCRENEEFKAKGKGLLKAGFEISKVFAGGYLEKKMGKDAAELIKELADKGTEEFMKEKSKVDVVKLFPDYADFRDAIKLLREKLTEIIGDDMLVIIVDELDRCKPTFAVQTLEIVKHLFNIKGLVFIFALDVSQLSHAVKVVYGSGFEAVGYLERFFNYMTLLPPTQSEDVVDMMLEHYRIEPPYRTEEVKNAFRIISRTFRLSLRDMKTVCAAYLELWETALEPYRNIPNALILYFYFLTMKYKMPVEFYRAVSKTDNELVGFLEKNEVPFLVSEANRKLLYEKFIKCFSVDEIGKMELYILSFGVEEEKKGEVVVKRKFIEELHDEGYIGGVKKQVLEEVGYVINKCSSEGVFRKEINTNNPPCASLVLYKPDFDKYDEIKTRSVMEYIYRQLELCDFTDGSNGEKIKEESSEKVAAVPK